MSLTQSDKYWFRPMDDRWCLIERISNWALKAQTIMTKKFQLPDFLLKAPFQNQLTFVGFLCLVLFSCFILLFLQPTPPSLLGGFPSFSFSLETRSSILSISMTFTLSTSTFQGSLMFSIYPITIASALNPLVLINHDST